MNKLYKQITKLIKDIGEDTTLENVKVKALDLKDGVLIFDEKTGWLALRKPVKTNALSNKEHTVYFNKVLYKKSDFPYCLREDLENVLDEIKKDDHA